MRKRQFGTKRLIYASDHNLAQNYEELNVGEVAIDGGIRGIITGGSLIPNFSIEYTIILEETIARTIAGERIVVPSSEHPVSNIFIKPSIDPGTGNEVWMTAYIEYTYQLGELDTDGDNVPYYKDYQNSYSIGTIQGTISPIGYATKPSIPYGAVLLCDILYNTTLYASGAIQQSDINVARQDRFDSQSFVNLVVTGTANVDGLITARSGIDMFDNNFLNLSDPTIGSEVGDRDYNDIRYVLRAGDTMTGTLYVPDIVVSASMTIQDLIINGTVLVGGVSVFNDDVNITGDLAVNAGGASIGHELHVLDYIEGKSLVIPWQSGVHYGIDEVIVNEEGIYKCLVAHTSTIFLLQIGNWESIGGGGGTTHRVFLVNHGFIVGDGLRYDSDIAPGGYLKAIANDVDTLGMFVVTNVLDANNFIVCSGGYFIDLSYTVNFTPNRWYYLSDTTAGLLSLVEPQISNPILYAISANEAYVFIFRPNVGANLHVDEYIAGIGQTKFPLTQLPINADYVTVTVDGVTQSQNKYTFFSSTGIVAGVEFTSPLAGDEEIRFQTVSNIFASGSNLVTEMFTSTLGQTQYTMAYVPISKEFLFISIDGAFKDKNDFNFTGTLLTFTTPLGAGNKVQLIHILSLNPTSPPSNEFDTIKVRDHVIFGSTGLIFDSSTGRTEISGLSVTGDIGSGISGALTLTNVTDDVLSTGTGAIKLKGTSTSQDSAGWIKMYTSTGVIYIPYFTDITGV